MQTLIYKKPWNPAHLHDAILHAVPDLAGTFTVTERIVREHPTIVETDDAVQFGHEKVAEEISFQEVKLRVEGDGETVTVTIPDSFDRKQIDTAVRKFVEPTDQEPPAKPSERLVEDLDAAESWEDVRDALAAYAKAQAHTLA